MEAKGEIKITEDLILTDPSLEVNSVGYDWNTNNVNIELLFTEATATYKHSRTFTFVNESGEELGSEDIYNFIKSDDTLKAFK